MIIPRNWRADLRQAGGYFWFQFQNLPCRWRQWFPT